MCFPTWRQYTPLHKPAWKTTDTEALHRTTQHGPSHRHPSAPLPPHLVPLHVEVEVGDCGTGQGGGHRCAKGCMGPPVLGRNEPRNCNSHNDCSLNATVTVSWTGGTVPEDPRQSGAQATGQVRELWSTSPLSAAATRMHTPSGLVSLPRMSGLEGLLPNLKTG